MQKFRKYADPIEAQLALGLLQSRGLTATLVGIQEYAGLYTGTGYGHYRLMLDPDQFAEATAILDAIPRNLDIADPEAAIEKRGFRFRRVHAIAIAWVVLFGLTIYEVFR